MNCRMRIEGCFQPNRSPEQENSSNAIGRGTRRVLRCRLQRGRPRRGGAFASRSDDSTFLGYSDANEGNSLLLPNRNLDSAYAKVDANFVYQLKPYLGFYTQLDNALSQQHISPIGSPSLPFTARTGIRLVLGRTLDQSK